MLRNQHFLGINGHFLENDRMISSLRLAAVVTAISSCLISAAFGQKAALSVDVKGADGRPVPNAQVRIDRVDKKMAPVLQNADQRGHITVSNLGAGVYKLTSTSAQGARSSQTIKMSTKPMLVTFNMSQAAAAPAQKKRYRWVQTPTGTHMLGHWEEEGGPAQTVDNNGRPIEQVSPESLHRMGQGSRLSGSRD